jgi:hypothetical protein
VQTLGEILQSAAGLGYLVCFIIVLVKMFQNGRTGLGITCILLSLCCGIGSLVAFVYGWINTGAWNLRTVMLIWTVCVILLFIGGALAPPDTTQLQHLQGNP